MLLLSVLTVCAVFLNVSPNRPQFFPGESVTLTCEGVHSPDGWTLKRRNYKEIKSCGEDFGQFDGSSCIISDLKAMSSYWCEDRSGQKSDELNIYVSDHVILEMPALPVMAGSNVTLSCRPRYDSYRVRSIDRKRESDRESFSAVHTIYNVQKSDEGVYSCSVIYTDMVMVSGHSRLTVAAPRPDPTSPSPPLSLSMLRVFCHLLVVGLYCISTILMLLICCSRNRNSGEEPAISMYDDVTADVTGDVTTDVTTEHEF
ncbi:unnamed protein product [Oreochromis niloticus]|nr:unnamed protein product [Mustela putorius furo]